MEILDIRPYEIGLGYEPPLKRYLIRKIIADVESLEAERLDEILQFCKELSKLSP